MRAINNVVIGLCGIVTIGLCGTVAFGQGRGPSGGQGAGRGAVVHQSAPTDKAVDFTLSALEAETAEMDAKKLATVRLLEGGAYNVNIRHLAGAETALMHGKKTDIYVVRKGSGTLVTGGELVDARKTGGEEGDQSGSSIRGGVSRVIKAGDVIFIPAGLPHGIRDVQGKITFLNIRFDTK